MKRILVSLVLLLMIAPFVVEAVEINVMREPVAVANATVTTVSFSATESYGLPTSIVAFTGSGDEFFVRFWGDWYDSGYHGWSEFAVAVPGAMTLPRISTAQDTLGAWYLRWEIYCATDSVTVIAGNK